MTRLEVEALLAVYEGAHGPDGDLQDVARTALHALARAARWKASAHRNRNALGHMRDAVQAQQTRAQAAEAASRSYVESAREEARKSHVTMLAWVEVALALDAALTEEQTDGT
jgi:hypothetical protein